jgi:hypothetical protein
MKGLELLTTTDWLMKNVHLSELTFSLLADPGYSHGKQLRWILGGTSALSSLFPSEGLRIRPRRPPLHTDPKQAWARSHLRDSPLDLNRADKRDLLRIPGIGPGGAEAILKARRTAVLKDLSAFKKLGIIAERAAPFILLTVAAPGQLELF